jgi:hypothetical protein
MLFSKRGWILSSSFFCRKSTIAALLTRGGIVRVLGGEVLAYGKGIFSISAQTQILFNFLQFPRLYGITTSKRTGSHSSYSLSLSLALRMEL